MDREEALEEARVLIDAVLNDIHRGRAPPRGVLDQPMPDSDHENDDGEENGED